MPQAEDEPAGLLNSYFTNQLTPEEERVLLASAAADQEMFNLLMEAEALRDALSSQEQRNRLKTALQLWDDPDSKSDEKRQLSMGVAQFHLAKAAEALQMDADPGASRLTGRHRGLPKAQTPKPGEATSAFLAAEPPQEEVVQQGLLDQIAEGNRVEPAVIGAVSTPESPPFSRPPTGESTHMMNTSVPPTLDQPEAKAKSNVLRYVAGGAVLLTIILIIVFAMRR